MRDVKIHISFEYSLIFCRPRIYLTKGPPRTKPENSIGDTNVQHHQLYVSLYIYLYIYEFLYLAKLLALYVVEKKSELMFNC